MISFLKFYLHFHCPRETLHANCLFFLLWHWEVPNSADKSPLQSFAIQKTFFLSKKNHLELFQTGGDHTIIKTQGFPQN